MGDGGPPHRRLEAIRALYPLSLHGVGLSIGSPRPLDRDHLAAARPRSIRPLRARPVLRASGLVEPRRGLPQRPAAAALRRGDAGDRLPTTSTRRRRRWARACCSRTPRPTCIFADSAISETEFLAEIARRTGCGLLLDVNNVFVCATNHGFDPIAYLDAFPLRHVGEIHLAGYAERERRRRRAAADRRPQFAGAGDASGRSTQETIGALGPTPTLIEWDNDVPAMAGPARRGAPRRCGDGAAPPHAGRGCAMPFEATIDSLRARAGRPVAARPAATLATRGAAGRAPLRRLSQQCRGRR